MIDEADTGSLVPCMGAVGPVGLPGRPGRVPTDETGPTPAIGALTEPQRAEVRAMIDQAISSLTRASGASRGKAARR